MKNMLQIGPHAFNELWKDILPEDFLSWKLPEERVANCARCPQVAAKNYNEIYRCCTFIPRVPNFLLGMALQSSSSLHLHVTKMIEQGFLTPEGLQHNPSQWLLALENDAAGTYGKSSKLVCPNLDITTKNCKIYAFRNASCATFFCNNDHGKTGAYFWDSLNDVMGRIEFRLMQWSLRAVGFDFDAYLEAYSSITSQGLQDAINAKTHTWKPEAMRRLWGSWFGREAELLTKTAQAVLAQRSQLRNIVENGASFLPLTNEQSLINKIKDKDKDFDETDGNEDDWDQGSISEAWDELRIHYGRLWSLPKSRTKMQLGSRVVIELNPRQSAKEIYFENCPYRAVKVTRKGETQWERYLTQIEYEVVTAVIEDKTCSTDLYAEIEHKGLKNPEMIVSEWIGLGLLRSSE